MARGKTSGNLKTYSLTRLLLFAHRKRFTGALVIHDQPDIEVFFVEGDPVFCDAVNQDDLLGKLLVQASLLQTVTVKEALELQRSRPDPLGRILMERGLTAQQLFEVLAIQQKRKILRLFLLDHQDFSFDTSGQIPKLAQELTHQRLDAPSLSWRGLVSISPEEKLETDLAQLADMDVHAPTTIVLPDPHDHFHDRAAALLSQRKWSIDELYRAVGKRKPVLAVVHYAWALGSLDIAPTKLRNATAPSRQSPAETGGFEDRQSLSGRAQKLQADATIPPPRMTSMFRSVADASKTASSDTTTAPPPPEPPSKPGKSKRRISIELPALPEGAAAEARQLHADLKRRLEGLSDKNLFEILDVPHDATKQQIKESYLALAKKFHPDRIAALGIDELTEPADQLFQRISEAFTTLLNDSQREEYRRIIEDTSLQGDRQAAQRVMEAEVDFQKGEVFFKKGDLDQAELFFARAVQGNPEEGEHLAMLSWVRHLKARKAGTSQESVTQTRQQLEQARTLSPKCPRIHYFLGKALLEEGRMESALESFRMAVRLNKHYVEAAREIHIIELRMARSTRKTKSSIWDKIRGK